MIIIFPIIGLFASWKLFKFAKKNEKPCEMTGWDALEISMVITGCIAVGILAFFMFGIVSENITSDIKYERLETERAALEWRLEQNYTNNDNNIGSTELYQEVTSFNKSITEGQTARRNIWLRWFYGNYYDRVELIELR